MANGVEFIYDLIDKISGPLTEIQRKLALTDKAASQTETGLEGIGNSAGTIHGVSSAFEGLGSSILSTAAGFGLWSTGMEVVTGIENKIKETIGEVFQVREEMERWNVVLKNSYQSGQLAAEAMEMLERYTTTAPVHLDTLTNTFIELREKGFTPTFKQLTEIGDIAASAGKNFEDVTNAVEMASLGMFRGLKQLGIILKANKGDTDHLTATFHGHKTVIDNNEESIRKYVLSIGEMAGVHGVAAQMMSELTGQESELVNDTHKLHEEMGKIFDGALSGWLHFKIEVVQGLTEFVDWISAHRTAIKDIFTEAAVGIGTAIGLYTIYVGWQKAVVFWETLKYLWMMRSVVAESLLATATWALNVAMDANPIGIIIGLIASLAAMLMYAWNHSEAFRIKLYQIWEVSKAVFSGLLDIGKIFIGAYVDLWKGLGEVILGVFMIPFDHGKMFHQGVGDIMASMTSMAHIPDAFKKIGEDVKKAAALGAVEGHDSFAKDQKEKQNQSVVNTTNALTGGSDNGGGGTSDNSSTAGAGSGAGGGRTIIIQKIELGNGIRVYAQTVKEGAQEIRRIFHEELIGAVRDVEAGMSNG